MRESNRPVSVERLSLVVSHDWQIRHAVLTPEALLKDKEAKKSQERKEEERRRGKEEEQELEDEKEQ